MSIKNLHSKKSFNKFLPSNHTFFQSNIIKDYQPQFETALNYKTTTKPKTVALKLREKWNIASFSHLRYNEADYTRPEDTLAARTCRSSLAPSAFSSETRTIIKTDPLHYFRIVKCTNHVKREGETAISQTQVITKVFEQ